jgi:hypothetical protein
MGMDVYGTAPKSETGEYFRNNVWWWHPLWDYCLELHGDITGAVEHGHSNDADGLDADAAHELGMRLLADLESGVTAEYERAWNEHIASLPMHKCKWCEGTGIRTDDVGVENGMPTRELEAEISIVVGRTHGYCNSCRGYGKVEHLSASYSFNTDNVREFAKFLVDCGGFEIC